MTDFEWKKAPAACRDWLSDQVSAKTLYGEVKAQRLKAARIGAGRNLLFCRTWINEWLLACADRPRKPRTTR